MALDDNISTINQLNQQGLDAVASGDFSLAVERHHDAVQLSRNSITTINPDYYAFSVAKREYAKRWLGHDLSKCSSALEAALKETEAAFAGRELILKAYGEAVKQKYRFFSFGDAMLIL